MALPLFPFLCYLNFLFTEQQQSLRTMSLRQPDRYIGGLRKGRELLKFMSLHLKISKMWPELKKGFLMGDWNSLIASLVWPFPPPPRGLFFFWDPGLFFCFLTLEEVSLDPTILPRGLLHCPRCPDTASSVSTAILFQRRRNLLTKNIIWNVLIPGNKERFSWSDFLTSFKIT